MRYPITLLLLTVMSFGCESMYPHRQGTLRPDGRIEPCHDSRIDRQACGNAIFNAPLLSKLKLGMTKEDVLALMKHDPERVEARMENGRSIEIWKYMQDYEQERMTAITLTDGRISAIDTVSWEE